MPLITPSRLAVLIVSFSLITFFWTFGLPHQTPQPSIPAIDHKNVHTDPIIPPSVVKTRHATTPTPIAHGVRPTDSDDDRWDDKGAHGGKGQAKPPVPSETGIVDYEKDGGRWEDKEKLKGGVKSGSTADAGAITVPTTLATEATPASKSANAVNASVAPAKPIEAVPTQVVDQFCGDVDGAKDVMVVLKTSKAEIQELSGHLTNFLSCVPTFAIFSDHAGEFRGHKVHDALDSIAHEIKFKNKEFQEYQLMHADAEHTPDATKTGDLDKWKFLPMVYKAYHMNPSAKFFVFLEADTSLSWTNTLQWLNRLDYRIPYYSGAPYYIAGTQVAQRGAGIMLSQGALRRYSKSYDELYQTKWEKDTSTECCGDLMLAKALADAHVEFYSSWPLLQSEQPSTLDYTRKHWCAPAVSWHHIIGDDLTRQWDIEKKWTTTNGWKKPYLYRDAYHDSVEPHIASQKAGWDNLSRDTKIVAPEGRQKKMKDDAEKKKQEGQEHDLGEPEDDPKDGAKPEKTTEKELQRNPKEGGQTQQEEKKEAEKIKVDITPPPDPRIYQEAGPSSKTKRQGNKGGKKGNKKEDEDKKAQLPNWDKLAEKHPDAADSSERCQNVCQQVEDCLQWRYTTSGDGECHLSKVIRLGGKVGDDKWTSGWLVDRIKGVAKEWECKEVKWRFYQ